MMGTFSAFLLNPAYATMIIKYALVRVSDRLFVGEHGFGELIA